MSVLRVEVPAMVEFWRRVMGLGWRCLIDLLVIKSPKAWPNKKPVIVPKVSNTEDLPPSLNT